MDKDALKKLVNDRIREIDQSYKRCYKTYEPDEKERKLIRFLDDIWGLRLENGSQNEEFSKKASIQLAFHDKNDKRSHYDRNFKLGKLHPSGKKTTPLWYLIYRLAQSRDYSFFLAPNIFMKSHGNYRNAEFNIAFSNCLFVDIDEVHTSKPVYNCTTTEIMQYLQESYPILGTLCPRYVLMSGGGLHLYFILEHTNNLHGTQLTNPLRKNQKSITRELIHMLGGDVKCTNLNRLLRMPFSCNTKYNIFTRLVENDTERLTYEKLTEQISLQPEPEESVSRPVPAVDKKRKEKKTATDTNKTRHDIAVSAKKALLTMRKSDLELYFRLHRKDLKGHRNCFFMIYSCTLKSLHYRKSVITALCVKMNDSLLEPYPESELFKVLEYDKTYLFANETIADMLDFTQAEIAMMQSNFGKEAIAEHRREYVRERSEKRRSAREEKEQRIRDILLENRDATSTELAGLLNVSVATVFRYKKKYLT